jgi:hypothetical protein
MVDRRFNPRGALIAILPVIAVLAGGCGGGSDSTSATTSPAPAAAATTTSAPASTAPTAGGDLSGTWSGQYTGTYQGTFTLSWQQSGSNLSGTIKLSGAGTESITGSVNGSSIRFGTVGGAATTYSGTVSGDSMSGSYNTPQGGGSWSASTAS